MGILDDAIREHLELKRMHGASEEELRQQEVEALGSPRREPDEADSEDLAVAEVADAEAPLEAAEEPAAGEALPEELEPEPDPEPEPIAVQEEQLAPEPLPVEPEPEPEPEPPGRVDTVPRGIEAVDEAEEPPEEPPQEDADDGDLLEDTPDFLQETPEHDRLWFEQKPPRDFDFD
jgi:hypothetical protein